MCTVLRLAKRFVTETRFLDEGGRNLCNQSLEVVTELFKDKKYKGQPYVTHLLRVAIRLMRDYEIRDPEMISASIFHDAVEDCGGELIEMLGEVGESALDVLARTKSERIAYLVGALTNEESSSANMSPEDKRENYLSGIKKKLAMGFDVFIIKLSDFTENAVGLHWGEDDSRTPKLAKKYEPVFEVFLDFVEVYSKTGELSLENAVLARGKLLKGQARCRDFARLY
jgi:(p)ppGpp synthase/HD superfamily hydrolase